MKLLAYHLLAARGDESSNKSDLNDFFEKIKSCIMSDDVRTPILLLLDDYSSHYGSRLPRHSVYREILLFILVSLGKDSIDIGKKSLFVLHPTSNQGFGAGIDVNVVQLQLSFTIN